MTYRPSSTDTPSAPPARRQRLRDDLVGRGCRRRIAWPAGWLDQLWPAFPERITTEPGLTGTDQPWWPRACGAVGLLAAVAGVRWLVAHLPQRRIGVVLLDGSGRDGRLLLAPAGPVGVAAQILAETPGARSASGRMIRDRGATVVDLHVVAEPHADLRDLAAAAESVTTDLREVIGRGDVAIRVALTVAARRRAIARVH